MSADNANTRTPSQPRELGLPQREYTGEMDEHLHEPAAAVYEIEVTPEMITAGASVLYRMELDFAREEFWAEEIYRAMASLSLPSRALSVSTSAPSRGAPSS